MLIKWVWTKMLKMAIEFPLTFFSFLCFKASTEYLANYGFLKLDPEAKTRPPNRTVECFQTSAAPANQNPTASDSTFEQKLFT